MIGDLRKDREQERITMGITVFNDGARQYYRITRAWEGREYQKYVRIDRDRIKARHEAEAIDRRLAERQRASQLRRELPHVRLFHEDGRIIGLNKALNRRKGRAARWEFKLRMRVAGESKPRFTSVSIDQHGFDRAFEMAVERICQWTGIDRFSDTRKTLLAASVYYLTDTHKQVVHLSSNAVPGDMNNLKQGLIGEIAAFKRNRNVINGSG